MTRPTRQIRPVLAQIEAKTLLSAGITGNVPGRHADEAASVQYTYREYIDVRTPGFKAIGVQWTVLGQKIAGGYKFDTLYNGNPFNLYTTPVPLVTDQVSSVATAPTFVFQYKNVSSGLTQTYDAVGVAWNNQGTMPTIPTVILPTPGRSGLTGQRAGTTYYYFAKINNETHDNSLALSWTIDGTARHDQKIPTGKTWLKLGDGNSFSPSITYRYKVNGTPHNTSGSFLATNTLPPTDIQKSSTPEVPLTA